MKFGKFEIYPVSDGHFRLDGGSMFGVVPKALWEKTDPADDKNRILMSVTPLLIIDGDKKILVDTGIGDKGSEKFLAMFAVDRSENLLKSLAEHNISAEDIDIVVCTHLHWDHVGGNTKKTDGGDIVPTFPNARYIVQKGEWADATAENERTRGSYHADDFVPVKDAGLMDLIDGDMELTGGIELKKIPGHNRHFMAVIISSEGKKAIYLGDFIPTASHLPYPFIMGYDLFPMETLESKKTVLKKAAEEDWLLIFEHDPRVKMGYIKMQDGKPVLSEVVEG